MTTLKWVEKNYDYQDIVDAGPKSEKIHISRSVDIFVDLQQVLDDCEVPAEEVKIDLGYYDSDTTFYKIEDHILTELERFKTGRVILRDKEIERVKKEKRDEKERRELERLKKKFGEK